jgi:hypothetical protein
VNDNPNLSSFIWSVAGLLRGDFKQSEYGRVYNGPLPPVWSSDESQLTSFTPIGSQTSLCPRLGSDLSFVKFATRQVSWK